MSKNCNYLTIAIAILPGGGIGGGVALDLHDGRGVLDDVNGLLLLLRGLEGHW